eukprot:9484472-Pyramimonas_sp.AAC.1
MRARHQCRDTPHTLRGPAGSSIEGPPQWRCSVGTESFGPLLFRSVVNRQGPSVLGRKRVAQAIQFSVRGGPFGPYSSRSELSPSGPSILGR